MLNLVFLGIQGSGKGTQAGLLKKNYGFKHINIGELLRQNMARKTSLGNKITVYMENGELVPDEYIFTLIEEHLKKKDRGIILDGFPRTLQQARYMEENIPVNYAIFFELDEEIAIKRLTARRVCRKCKKDYNLIIKPPKNDLKCDDCGGELILRSDDHKSAIERRINIFMKRTKPLITFFEKRDMLIKIDASNTPEQIHRSIIRRTGIEK